MEDGVGRSESRRGRKRRRNDVEGDQYGKKKAAVLRPKPLLGRYVKKKLRGNVKYLGKVICYDSGWYKVIYEDGKCNDFDSSKVKAVLVEDDELNGQWLDRKKNLDELVASREVKSINSRLENAAEPVNPVIKKSKVPVSCDSDYGGDSDSLSDLCEDHLKQDSSLEVDVPLCPAPQLPPSSDSIGIPEEYVSYLLSVYSFLRSFSFRLFLSPFGLDDFVGALNCSTPNTLLDYIHVALMRALRRHLKSLSSRGSSLAVKCLRNIDWNLLDTVTWPIYVVLYLTIMGEPVWEGFYPHTMQREYYLLSSGTKLMVLQILCDHVLDSEEIRAEVDMREESEVGIEPDISTDVASVSVPRIVHPRSAKTSACKGQEAIELCKESNVRKMSCTADNSVVSRQESVSYVEQHIINSDECRLCGMEGTLLCCDGCPSSYHARCIGVCKMYIPEGAWYCPECRINEVEPKITEGTTLNGAKLFGVDSYGQIFMGTCSHLLVYKTLNGSNSTFRYYNKKDIPRVLKALDENVQHTTLYLDICKGIAQCWKIHVKSLFPNGEVFEIVSERSNVTKYDNSSTLLLRSLVKGSPEREKTVTCTPISSSRSCIEQVNSNCAGIAVSLECDKTFERPNGIVHKDSTDGCLYMGSSFRPHRYINSYLHGDFAASAAANLAELFSEKSQGAVSRQELSASVLLQVKAFSSAATRFFWPNTEKRSAEVPRERCSWCVTCKAAATCKKGCLLNSAASTAIKGAVKILAGLRPASGGEGNLPSIVTYIMLMEESLSGLTVGPFLSASFRKQWRKQAEEATNFTVIKSLLLEFEENIRSVAFSGDWFKLVDDGTSESFIIHSAAKSIEKRKPGRPGRKPLSMVKISADKPLGFKVSPDKPRGFTWWRGGILSKLLLQKATLPRSALKKASRHSGKRIPGICYAEGSETAKRTKQLAWRAAVDLSKTISQLALQVRYLDVHLRWSDLAHPEQHDGKGPETEAFAFRNASICCKRLVGNEVRYSIAFGNQKHIPSRLMKSIIEVEQNQEGKEIYWFSESRIPLYLIKEYEEKLAKDLPPANQFTNALPKLQKRTSVAPRKDVFSYLARKRDGNHQHCCASCQLDVLFRNAVKCNTCQGLCHKQCTISSTVVANEEVEFMMSCKQCYQNIASASAESNHESPTSTTVPVSAKKSGKSGSSTTPLASTAPQQKKQHRHASSSNLVTKTKPHWGVIWRKKKDESGSDFRSKHILVKGNPERDLLRPSCHLCHKPYDPFLIYIRCETCMHWFHAEAIGLEESKIVEVVGFKCCRCRRVKIPICPYLDPKSKKQLEEKRMRLRALKMDSPELQRDENPHTVERDTSRTISASQFEPQTYFSYHELLGSDKNAGKPCVKHKPATNTTSSATTVVCKMCSNTKPCPDLCCETCEIWIHRHCSPWLEEESGEDGWKCGNCREWR